MEHNDHLIERMMTPISSSGENVCLESSTELDSHANMVVIGKQAFIFSHSGQYTNVQAFTDEVKGITKVPIVDAVIRGRPRTNGSVRTNCNALKWGCRPIDISGRPIETSWLCTLY